MNNISILKSKPVKNYLLLFIVLAAGLFFRIYNLGNESIWIDEGISIKIAAKLGLSQIIKAKVADLPLYHIILHYWVKLFGTSEYSARFPSVIFGFLVLFMTYKVGCLIFDPEVGILGSLLSGLSMFHIQYSQEARMYALMGFLTLLSMYFFIKLFKKSNFINLIGYALSSALLMSTHLSGLFIILSQNFYVLTLFLLSKEEAGFNIKRWLILQAILIIPLFPLANFLIGRAFFIKQFSYWWIPKPSLISIAVSFLEYSGSLPLMLIFFILSFLSILTYRKLSGAINFKNFFGSVESYHWNVGMAGIKNIYLLLVWLFSPIILLYIISQFLIPIYWTRYTIGCSVAFYLLAAKGIRNINYKYVKLLVITIIVIFSLTNISSYYREVHKEQWREVAEYIDINAQHRDLLIFNSSTGQVPFNYYSKRRHLAKKDFLSMYDIAGEENIKRLESITAGRDRVWVILSHSHDPEGLIKDYFDQRFNLLYSKKYMRARYINIKFSEFINKYDTGIEVYLFEKKR